MFSIDIDDDLELQDLVPHFQRVDISGDDNTGVSNPVTFTYYPSVHISLHLKELSLCLELKYFRNHIVDISNLDYLIY